MIPEALQGGTPAWHLRLYVAGEAPRSLAALVNLRALCTTHCGEDYRIEVIDLLEQPAAAQADQVIMIPTTVRLAPSPRIQVIGDLSDQEKARRSLGLPPDNLPDNHR